MTNQQHPITPPPELVQQWVAEIWHEGTPVRVSLSDEHIATRAAQWGADQELHALLTWLRVHHYDNLASDLLAARRPKPPSLAEQALMGLEQTVIMLMPVTGRKKNERFDIIRRALERLKELENNG